MAKRAPKASQKKSAVTRRYKLFVERYLINGNNATDAAKVAGYNPHTAHAIGWHMLRRPEVQELLGQRADEVVSAAQLTTERWAEEMAAIGHMDPGELYDEHGDLIPVKKLPEHVRRAIASIKREHRTEGKGETRETVVTEEVKLHDKNTALANIGKHLGVFERDNRQRAVAIQINVVGRG